MLHEAYALSTTSIIQMSMPKFLNFKTTKALPLFHPYGSEDRASVNCVDKNKSQYLLSSIFYKLIRERFKE